jgi:hypothetical protein
LLASLQLPSATRRRTASLLGVILLATALGVVNAPAAQAEAYTCPEDGAKTIELNDGSASATIHVNENCSDGQSHFSGVVRDINCDARGAYLLVEYWLDFLPRSEEPHAPNGCNTEATFDFEIADPEPYVRACVVAENWGPTTSETDCETF